MARIREKTLKFPGLDNTYTFADEADLFSSETPCTAGKYYIKDGDLYLCVVDHTGAWNASHFMAVKLGDEVSDLSTRITNKVTHTEETNFTTNVSTIEVQHDFSAVDPDYVKYTGLSINSSSKLFTSSAADSFLFRNPYYGFKFSVYDYGFCLVLATKPVGTSGEQLNVVEALKATGTGGYSTFTINYPKGTYFIFNFRKNDDTSTYYVRSNLTVPYKSTRLELDGVQDSFARYAVRNTSPSSDGNVKLNITKVVGKLITTTTGGLQDNASYDTYIFQVLVSQVTIKCSNGYRAARTWKDPTTISAAGYLKELIYENATGRVETFTATYGDYVAISLAKNTYSALDLKTDYVETFTLPSQRIAPMQSQMFYKYEKGTTAKYLHIYFKSGDNWVKWELHNVPANDSNSDTWQIGHVCGLDTNLENMMEIVRGGEFELAYKEHGADDYCGGNNHGDETTDSFTLFIDGEQVNLATLDTDDYHVCSRIDAFEEATVNRCNTPAEDILKHQKIWTFENGKVKVRQTIKFLEQLVTDTALICMFPALRYDESDPPRPIFTHGVRQGRIGIETMTDATYTKVHTISDEIFYEMYGTIVTAKIHAKTDKSDNASDMWINNAEALNKLYYNYFGTDSSNPITVPADTIITAESEYDVSYTPYPSS